MMRTRWVIIREIFGSVYEAKMFNRFGLSIRKKFSWFHTYQYINCGIQVSEKHILCDPSLAETSVTTARGTKMLINFISRALF